MQILLVLLLFVSCSSEKKSDKKIIVAQDTDELVAHDWNGDGLQETITLGSVNSKDAFRELVVYQGTNEGMPKEKMFSNKNIIPMRALPGARLRLLNDHSVLLTIESSASGRNHDVITWKFRWKLGRFVVTHFTREWMDKLDPSIRKTCDLELRTGRGKLNGKPVKFEPVRTDLVDLNQEFIPSICIF